MRRRDPPRGRARPDGCDQTAATPGPATRRTWLPSRPGGGGGSVSPASAAARAARSAEKVKVALTSPPTWYVGSPVTPRGRLATSGTSRPVSAAAAAASGTVRTSRSPVTSSSPYALRSGRAFRSSVLRLSGAICSVRKMGSQPLAAAVPGAGQDGGDGDAGDGRAPQRFPEPAGPGRRRRRRPAGGRQRRRQALPGGGDVDVRASLGGQRRVHQLGVLADGGQHAEALVAARRGGRGRRRRRPPVRRAAGAAPLQSDDAWRFNSLRRADSARRTVVPTLPGARSSAAATSA